MPLPSRCPQVVTTQCNVPTNVTVFHTSVHSISGYVTPYTFDLRYVFERQGMLHELRVSRRDPKIYNAEKRTRLLQLGILRSDATGSESYRSSKDAGIMSSTYP
jgi:hypothetical protein